jgi:hypothetical protein
LNKTSVEDSINENVCFFPFVALRCSFPFGIPLFHKKAREFGSSGNVRVLPQRMALQRADVFISVTSSVHVQFETCPATKTPSLPMWLFNLFSSPSLKLLYAFYSDKETTHGKMRLRNQHAGTTEGRFDTAAPVFTPRTLPLLQ